uniref:SFRICE_031218 n=1 Tax=Spodoptera frugiperda TaxID=7108 RepID=A0A2H1VU76_SPOFR
MEEAVEEPSEQYAESEEFKNLYYALVASARQLVGSARKHLTGDSAFEVVSGSSHTHNHSSVRLPKIDLPKFSGSYHDWLEFRDTFISIIHKNEGIDKINKLHYLRASLKGSASLIIDNLDFSPPLLFTPPTELSSQQVVSDNATNILNAV